MNLPTTNEELLELMKTVFTAGQESMKGELKYERFGDMESYAITVQKYGFKEWANQKWKYGKLKD